MVVFEASATIAGKTAVRDVIAASNAAVAKSRVTALMAVYRVGVLSMAARVPV
jgi:hypothetical protein